MGTLNCPEMLGSTVLDIVQKYGCYCLRENRVNKVLDVQLVQVFTI